MSARKKALAVPFLCLLPFNLVWAGIHPLTGELSESVPLGISLGGISVSANYSTIPKLGNLKVLKQPSMGALWNTTLHRNLAIVTNGSLQFIKAYRGDGHSVPFSGINNVYSPGTNTQITDSLTYSNGKYFYLVGATGDVETYDSAGVLRTISRRDGRQLSLAYSSGASAIAPDAGYLVYASDNTGRYVRFEYGTSGSLDSTGAPMTPAAAIRRSKTQGLMTKIADSNGTVISIQYDASKSNVESFSWNYGRAIHFLYENASYPWAITGELDEAGTRLITWQYGSGGLATGVSDAVGATSSVSYTSPPSVSHEDTLHPSQNILFRRWYVQPPQGVVVTNPAGVASTWTAASVNGGSVSVGLAASTQSSGSGCAAANNYSEFDSNGNITVLDDFSGNRSCFGYDSRNNRVVSVEGLLPGTACAALLLDGATLPSGASKTKSVMSPAWNLPVTLLQPNLRTTRVYQGHPDPFNGNAIANCSSAPALPNGFAPALLCKEVKESLMAGFDSTLSVDALASNNIALLKFEGNFNDAGGQPNQTWTKVGNPIISAPTGYPTNSSAYFDGASGLKFQKTSAWNFGSGDGSWELRVFPTLSNPTQTQVLMASSDCCGGYTDFGIYLDTTNHPAFWYFDGANWKSLTASAVATPNKWTHIAAQKANGVVTLYVDGKSQGTLPMAVQPSASSQVGIGQNGGYTAGQRFTGYIDDVRVTKGVARYIGDFPLRYDLARPGIDLATPTVTTTFSYDANGRLLTTTDSLNRTSAISYFADQTIGTSSDSQYPNVSLLLHGSGSDGGKVFVDSSLSAIAPTLVSGNVVTISSDSRFGGGSIKFDGQATSYIDYPVAPITAPGDYTIEGWIKTSQASSGAVFDNYPPSNAFAGTLLYAYSGGLGWYYNGNNPIWVTANLSQWTHFAAVKYGTTCTLYVNGSALGSATCSYPIGSPDVSLRLGNAHWSTAYPFSGNINDFRITIGTARYLTNFNPPTAPMPTTSDPLGTAVGHYPGDIASVTNPKGQTTQFRSYDGAGRVLQSIDSNGVTTDLSYTPRGLVSMMSVTPLGQPARVTTYTYDAVGQLTGVANPDGTTISYSYDAAHRLIGATDAKGNTVSYTLDNMGNRLAEQLKDPSGALQRTMSRSFDALNRVQQLQVQ